MPLASALIKCISKPISERGSKDIDLAFEWFKKFSDLYDDSEPGNFISTSYCRYFAENLRELIKYCELAVAYPDEVIVKQHDNVDGILILISGAVSMFTSSENRRRNDSGGTHRLHFWNESEGSDSVNLSNSFDSNDNATRVHLDRSKLGRFLGTVDPGQSLGEYDLLEAETSRQSSFIADEACRLMVIDGELYDYCLRPFRGLQFSARQKFAQSCPLFASWPKRFIEMAVMSLKPESAVFGMNIVEQGEAVNGLIFLVSGEVKIQMNLALHVTQYPQLDLESFKGLKEDGGPRGAKEWQTGAAMAWTSGQDDLRQKFRTSTNSVELSLLGAGEILGELECARGLTTYAQTAVSITQTDYYTLNARNFERLLTIKRDATTLGIVNSRVEERILNQCFQPSFPCVPLLQYFATDILHLQKIEDVTSTKAMLNQEINKIASDSRFIFSLPPGPVVNQYGPGSAFYYTRMMRKLRAAGPKTKQAGQPKTRHEETGPNPNLPGDHEAVQLHLRSTSMRHPKKAFDESHTNSEVLQHLYVDDWETGSIYLNDLEQRMQLWLQDVGSYGEKLVVTPLKRSSDTLFENPHGLRKVLPGVPFSQHRKMVTGKVERCSQKVATDRQGSTARPRIGDFLVRSQILRPKSAGTYKDSSSGFHTAVSGGKSVLAKSQQYTLEEYQDLRTELREREKSFLRFKMKIASIKFDN